MSWLQRALLLAALAPACAGHGADRSSPAFGSDIRSSREPPPGECSQDVPLVPPMIVGPGRIRILVSGGPHDFWFRVVDLTSTGSEVFVEDECPERSQPEAMALLASGATGIACRVGNAVYFGSVPPAGGKVDWLWREQLQLGGDGWHVLAVRHLAEIEDRVAIVFEVSGIKGSYPPWHLAVQVAPGGQRHFLCARDVACPDRVVTLLAAGARVHVIGEKAFHYSDFTLGRSSEPLPTDPIRGATIMARNRPTCVAQSEDRSVIVSLPLERAPGVSAMPGPATAILRYADTTLPLGPFVYPADAASCDWKGFDAPELPSIPGAFDWARATLGDRWLMVYKHTSSCPDLNVDDRSPGAAASVDSFWVYRAPRQRER